MVGYKGRSLMALLLDFPPCMGASYCLMRTRVKRRRKKRSERKGQLLAHSYSGGLERLSFTLILSSAFAFLRVVESRQCLMGCAVCGVEMCCMQLCLAVLDVLGRNLNLTLSSYKDGAV